jgi:hypothetical protein
MSLEWLKNGYEWKKEVTSFLESMPDDLPFLPAASTFLALQHLNTLKSWNLLVS